MSVAAQRAAQPARFLVVGAAGYGVNLLAFALLVAAGVRYVLASVVSYLVSNVLIAQALSLLAVTPPAYMMFKRWTFRLDG